MNTFGYIALSSDEKHTTLTNEKLINYRTLLHGFMPLLKDVSEVICNPYVNTCYYVFSNW